MPKNNPQSRLENRLKNSIENKRPTIKDVANAAQVSAALVSRVINNKPGVSKAKRALISKTMVALDYFPNSNAQAINHKYKKAIGIITPNLIAPYFASMANGIENIATKYAIPLLLNSSSFDKNKELNALDTLIEHRYQSIILFSPSISDEVLIAYAKKAAGLVLIDRYIPQIKERCVWLNDELGGQLMAKNIIENGHKHIAIIDLPHSYLHSRKRIIGVLSTLAAHNINVPTCLLETKSGTYQDGEIAAYNLLASGQKFTALLCMNDAMAAGAAHFIQEQGLKVPEDISIIGFNNALFSKMCNPILSTVNNPILQMAERATELSLRLTSAKLSTAHNATNTTNADKTKNTEINDSLNQFTPVFISNNSVAKIT